MQPLLDTEYADLTGVLAARKTAGHRNLAGTIAVIKDDDENPPAWPRLFDPAAANPLLAARIAGLCTGGSGKRCAKVNKVLTKTGGERNA
jgi:hypothetical protein